VAATGFDARGGVLLLLFVFYLTDCMGEGAVSPPDSSISI